jgi:multicomponent Na+:H+ antiporter subunit E
MPVLIFLLWFLFNGRVTVEIALFGVGISILVSIFSWQFISYSPKTDLKILKNFFKGLHYLGVLIWEMTVATLLVMKVVLSSRVEIDPVLIRFKTSLKSGPALVTLANSITLTPGTITCNLDNEGAFIVHCLDRGMGDGIGESRFVQLLLEMEANVRGYD